MQVLHHRHVTVFFFGIAGIVASLGVAGCGAASSIAPLPVAATSGDAGVQVSQALDVRSAVATASDAEKLAPYDPPAGVFPFFPTSIFHERIPKNPSVNPNTATWLSSLGTLGIGKLQFAENSAGLANDFTYPIYPMASVAAGGMPVKIHCTEPWGTCNVEGKTVYVMPNERPEDYGSGGDEHMTLVDVAHDKEYDFWGTQWPPSNGTLTINWGGSCSLSGDGYSHCSATATSTPLSVGIIRVNDLLRAIRGPRGSLPYALQVATKCSNGSVAPMISGDGHKAGCAPEGSRVYLAMHDGEVDAGAQSPIEKAILRTIDEDHYGMIITDTNGGEDGFSIQAESDLTYTAFGKPGPLVNELIPEATKEGMGGTAPWNNTYYLQLPMTGIDFTNELKFL
jgi:hypothetical protein